MSSVSFNSLRSIPRPRDKWDKQTNEEEEIEGGHGSHSIGQKVVRLYANRKQQDYDCVQHWSVCLWPPFSTSLGVGLVARAPLGCCDLVPVVGVGGDSLLQSCT